MVSKRTVRVTGNSVKTCSSEFYSVEITKQEVERAVAKFHELSHRPMHGQHFKCEGTKIDYIRPSSTVERVLNQGLFAAEFWGIDLKNGIEVSSDAFWKGWILLS